ncbi:hypothetical protein AB0451_03070 [Streptomyces sp. NPDC052000]|uniref:hypothetical protein n=1 Tax=Streptomyces sp. NPDC052000 TaxID=3155676 RepID=UPI00344F21EF
MIWPAESIYEGTWSSGPAPEEVVDFEIMREMGWSWRDLEATPIYVRRYVWDLILARRQAEQASRDR